MLLIISFDAVGDRVFDRLKAMPNTGAFLRSATVARRVSSVFLTNTYPVHTSVVTGLPPVRHGLISNEPAFPRRYPVWNYRARGIGTKTLWQAVREKGMTTASVLWPVTGGAREIRWNIPEIVPRPGQNQILLNLKNGSKLTQLDLWFRYRRLLDGISQPSLDRFTAACMADILRRRKPDLALVHFTAYDTLCHHYGEDFDKLEPTLRVLDDGLGLLLDVLEEGGRDAGDSGVILFADHAQLPLIKTILPNDILTDMGLLRKDRQGDYMPGKTGCFIECCGGSAFIHPGNLRDSGDSMTALRKHIEESPGFNRWLTHEEMETCGRGNLPGGFCALPGWAYEAYDQGEKAQHGYPADYEDYRVFYALRGPSVGLAVPQGKTVDGGSLLDIAPLALRLLGEGLPPEQAPCIPGLPPARSDFFVN
jgi:hypothetical protein